MDFSYFLGIFVLLVVYCHGQMRPPNWDEIRFDDRDWDSDFSQNFGQVGRRPSPFPSFRPHQIPTQNPPIVGDIPGSIGKGSRRPRPPPMPQEPGQIDLRGGFVPEKTPTPMEPPSSEHPQQPPPQEKTPTPMIPPVSSEHPPQPPRSQKPDRKPMMPPGSSEHPPQPPISQKPDRKPMVPPVSSEPPLQPPTSQEPDRKPMTPPVSSEPPPQPPTSQKPDRKPIMPPASSEPPLQHPISQKPDRKPMVPPISSESPRQPPTSQEPNKKGQEEMGPMVPSQHPPDETTSAPQSQVPTPLDPAAGSTQLGEKEKIEPSQTEASSPRVTPPTTQFPTSQYPSESEVPFGSSEEKDILSPQPPTDHPPSEGGQGGWGGFGESDERGMYPPIGQIPKFDERHFGSSEESSTPVPTQSPPDGNPSRGGEPRFPFDSSSGESGEKGTTRPPGGFGFSGQPDGFPPFKPDWSGLSNETEKDGGIKPWQIDGGDRGVTSPPLVPPRHHEWGPGGIEPEDHQTPTPSTFGDHSDSLAMAGQVVPTGTSMLPDMRPNPIRSRKDDVSRLTRRHEDRVEISKNMNNPRDIGQPDGDKNLKENRKLLNGIITGRNEPLPKIQNMKPEKKENRGIKSSDARPLRS